MRLHMNLPGPFSVSGRIGRSRAERAAARRRRAARRAERRARNAATWRRWGRHLDDVTGDVRDRDPGTASRHALTRSVAYRGAFGWGRAAGRPVPRREPPLTAEQSWARTVANWEAHRPTREDPR